MENVVNRIKRLNPSDIFAIPTQFTFREKHSRQRTQEHMQRFFFSCVCFCGTNKILLNSLIECGLEQQQQNEIYQIYLELY